MSHIHDQTNLRPQDYEVVAYLDNAPFTPENGCAAFMTPEMRKQWEDEMAYCLGADWRKVAYHCKHCGNGCVRFIAACQHIPTGEVVVFGSSCVHRLGFKDEKQFQLARIKSRAETERVRLKAFVAREALLAANPELAAAVADTAHHNNFVQDVIRKLNTYGDLSPRQIEAVIKSVTQTREYASAPKPPPAPPAPIGRQTVKGQVVHTKEVEGAYGSSTKCLVVLTDGAKVWGTLPSGAGKGDEIEFSAEFEPKKDDPSFAFYKRPTKLVIAASAT